MTPYDGEPEQEQEPATTAQTDCKTCGRLFAYEPIFIGTRDLARSLATLCCDCKAEMEAAEMREIKLKATIERRAIVCRTLPPALRPKHLHPEGTDTEHPEFNLPMWKLIKLWRPGKRGNWIALVGPAGKCKTRCLALLAEKIIMQGNRLVWTSAMRLHTEATINLRSHDRALQIGAREHLAECQSAPWLVLDDLGSNEWSPAFESQLFTILDYRKNNFLPMAFSSNADPEQFHSLITSVDPAALIGRLISGTDFFDFTPPDQVPLPL